MATKTVSTFCRICEPNCGVLATVEDGRITGIRANKDHVLSQGHFCKKAQGMIDVTYDPDRVLYPLKRVGGPGEFERISWDQAYREIAAGLTRVRGEHGNHAVATYMGNPPYYSYAAMMGIGMFKQAMDIRWSYCVNGEDGNAIMASCSLLYGSVGVQPRPDYWRTDFVLIDGSNPLVSHGSPLCEPRIGTALQEVCKRGGRVVVVDPRRTETAREFEHVPINASTDAYLLSAMIREIVVSDLVDTAAVAAQTANFDVLKQAVSHCTPEWAESHCGVPAATIRQLAHDFARAKSAAVHCRLGTSSQRYGTLSTMLAHILCVITGNLDRPGGLVFGFGVIDMGKVVGTAPFGANPSRVDKLPDVAGDLPSVALVNDIEQPGDGQVRALIMLGANPCLNSPATGPRLDAALQKLDLFVATDLYVNDTNRFAHYVLPSAAMYERDDVPFLGMGLMIRPSLYATRAVIEKRGECKEDAEILDDICRYMGLGGALPNKAMRFLARLGLRLKPKHFMDLIIRTSFVGDKFGLKRGGLSLKKLMDDHPNGVQLRPDVPTGVFDKTILTPDRKIDVGRQEILSEIARLDGDTFYRQAAFPLRLFGMRKKSTQNSWMHNVPALARDHRDMTALLHPGDAASRGIHDGDTVRIRSAHGELEVRVSVTADVKPGNVSMPHGWGHRSGMAFAMSEHGVNSNILASDRPEDSDRISAMALLNGIPIQVAAVTPA